MENIKAIIESLIFVAGEPVSLDRLKRVLAPASTEDIRQALSQLVTEYEQRSGGFSLKEVAGGYQFRTRPEFNEWIKLLLKPKTPRLSKAALETLALIAYKQPIIRSDIEHIRGVDCGGVLRVLLERNLIRVLGRKDIPGRPLIYGTTKHFLAVFDLKDLKDLPTPKEIEELEASSQLEGSAAALDEPGEPFDTDPMEVQDPENKSYSAEATGDEQDPLWSSGAVDDTGQTDEKRSDPAKAPDRPDGREENQYSSEQASDADSEEIENKE
jgi:segregation and condensation protein B